MSENDASRIIIDDSRVMLQIVESLIDDSRGVIYNCNMFIVKVTAAAGSAEEKSLGIILVYFFVKKTFHK
jgi:hypothetical protein